MKRFWKNGQRTNGEGEFVKLVFWANYTKYQILVFEFLNLVLECHDDLIDYHVETHFWRNNTCNLAEYYAIGVEHLP